MVFQLWPTLLNLSLCVNGILCIVGGPTFADPYSVPRFHIASGGPCSRRQSSRSRYSPRRPLCRSALVPTPSRACSSSPTIYPVCSPAPFLRNGTRVSGGRIGPQFSLRRSSACQWRHLLEPTPATSAALQLRVKQKELSQFSWKMSFKCLIFKN